MIAVLDNNLPHVGRSWGWLWCLARQSSQHPCLCLQLTTSDCSSRTMAPCTSVNLWSVWSEAVFLLYPSDSIVHNLDGICEFLYTISKTKTHTYWSILPTGRIQETTNQFRSHTYGPWAFPFVDQRELFERCRTYGGHVSCGLSINQHIEFYYDLHVLQQYHESLRSASVLWQTVRNPQSWPWRNEPKGL